MTADKQAAQCKEGGICGVGGYCDDCPQPVATPRTRAAQHNMGSLAEPHYVVDVEVAEEIERELAALEAEIEVLRKDAERYRYHVKIVGGKRGIYLGDEIFAPDGWTDAAIDDAMKDAP